VTLITTISTFFFIYLKLAYSFFYVFGL